MKFAFAASLTLILFITKIHGFDLNCEFKTDQTWIYVTGEGCSAKSALIDSPGQVLTSVNNKIVSDYHNQVVNFLSFFGNQTVNYFPKGIEEFFPNLQGIEISDAELKTIEQSDLKPFGQLKELWLNNNDLESLANDLFEFNPEILFVHFANNKLKFIGDNLLNPLLKLASAYFNNNTCVDAAARTMGQISSVKTELKSKCAFDS